MSTGKNKGKGKKSTNPKAKTVKARDTATSPYYKAQKKGGVKAALSKRQMADYFKNVNGNNKRGETESQHMARMRKREAANRKNMGLKPRK